MSHCPVVDFGRFGAKVRWPSPYASAVVGSNRKVDEKKRRVVLSLGWTLQVESPGCPKVAY